MTGKHDKDIDQHSGVETTGHEWDGLKELNNPAPRWWLWVFFITVLWSLWYFVVYPAWPTLSGEGERGGTAGSYGWTQYKKLSDDQQEILARRGVYAKRLSASTLDDIAKDPELYAYALAGGKAAFKENCAACHGTGAQGSAGYPNLNDDDWIWGGTLHDIYHTLKVGIRSAHPETRSAMMPAFGGMLSAPQITALATHVASLSGNTSGSEEGSALFSQHCAVCHGSEGKGGREYGAPNLADSLWLYGASRADIARQIRQPKHGVMPAWDGRLSDDTIKQLSIYVHALGGGEKDSAEKPEPTPTP